MAEDRLPAHLSRRLLLGSGAALGVGIGGLAGTGTAHAEPGPTDRTLERISTRPARDAVSFLQRATDAYRTSGFRLAQSYQDNSGLTDIAFVYDNALTSMALLSAGDLTRARAIGDALLYAQDNDADYDDFRLRQAYHADGFVDGAGNAIPGYQFGFVGTAVGDMAWSGIALAQLARRTGDARYLTGALRIGTWIQTNAFSSTGLGGYTFGATAGLEDNKSSEHNIDLFAFFRMLARLSGDQVWLGRAEHAWAFVERVWNAEEGFFWTGSDDGNEINKNPLQLPLDVQTWSWLAGRRTRYSGALDWAASNLATTDTPLRPNSTLTGNVSVSGVVFASGSLRADTTAPIGGQTFNPNPDDGAVWFEGTAQLALSLRERRQRVSAAALLLQIAVAQSELGQDQTFGGAPAPGGIVAASSPLDTGFGFGYFPNLHIGATSWFVFAASGFNPYQFS